MREAEYHFIILKKDGRFQDHLVPFNGDFLKTELFKIWSQNFDGVFFIQIHSIWFNSDSFDFENILYQV